MKLDACMATRNPQMPGRKPGEACTEFQLHKSQLPNGMSKRNLFDYTEFRLKKYIEFLKDETQKETLLKVLHDYRTGMVAVAWKAGKPVWFAITKESARR